MGGSKGTAVAIDRRWRRGKVGRRRRRGRQGAASFEAPAGAEPAWGRFLVDCQSQQAAAGTQQVTRATCPLPFRWRKKRRRRRMVTGKTGEEAEKVRARETRQWSQYSLAAAGGGGGRGRAGCVAALSRCSAWGGAGQWETQGRGPRSKWGRPGLPRPASLPLHCLCLCLCLCHFSTSARWLPLHLLLSTGPL